MPTQKPRLNITFESEAAKLLELLAKRKGKSISALAKEMILDAIERDEDIRLSELADIREQLKSKRVSHDDAWK